MLKEVALVTWVVVLARAAPTTNIQKSDYTCHDVRITMLQNIKFHLGKAEAWSKLVTLMTDDPVVYQLNETEVAQLQINQAAMKILIHNVTNELSMKRPSAVDLAIKSVSKRERRETTMMALSTADTLIKISRKTRRSLSSPRKESYITITRDRTSAEKTNSSFKEHQIIRLGGSLSSSRKESYVTITAEDEGNATLATGDVQEEEQVKMRAPVTSIPEDSSGRDTTAEVVRIPDAGTAISAVGGAVAGLAAGAGGAVVGLAAGAGGAVSGSVGSNILTLTSTGTTTSNVETAGIKASDLIKKVVKSAGEEIVFEFASTAVEEIIELAAPMPPENEDLSKLEATLKQLENMILREGINLEDLTAEAVLKDGQILMGAIIRKQLAEAQSKLGRIYQDAVPVRIWNAMKEIYKGPPNWNPELNGLRAEFFPREDTIAMWAPLICKQSSIVRESTQDRIATRNKQQRQSNNKSTDTTIFLIIILIIVLIVWVITAVVNALVLYFQRNQ